jgi:hypothetical protein
VTDPTTPGPGESGPAGLRQARDALRAAVESLLDGHGLEIRELPHDFLVSNPREPEKGYVYIGIPDGHAAWKHTVWDHFGSLTDADPETGSLEASAEAERIIGKIIAALTGTTLGRM